MTPEELKYWTELIALIIGGGLGLIVLAALLGSVAYLFLVEEGFILSADERRDLREKKALLDEYRSEVIANLQRALRESEEKLHRSRLEQAADSLRIQDLRNRLADELRQWRLMVRIAKASPAGKRFKEMVK